MLTPRPSGQGTTPGRKRPGSWGQTTTSDAAERIATTKRATVFRRSRTRYSAPPAEGVVGASGASADPPASGARALTSCTAWGVAFRTTPGATSSRIRVGP